MSLPPNVHVSSHPVVKAKISQIRQDLSAKSTKHLISEISSLLAAWVGEKAFTIEQGPQVSFCFCYYISGEASKKSMAGISLFKTPYLHVF